MGIELLSSERQRGAWTALDFRKGAKAAVKPSPVSAAPPHSGHKADPERPPVGAMSRHSALQQLPRRRSILFGLGKHLADGRE
jgi:hypothetical protein